MNKSTSDLIPVYKPLGMTPAQAIDIFKIKNPKYKNESISHAGKLDPLAEGLLLLVTGKLTHPQNLRKLLKLDKEYRAKILFGFSTDSYDIQGIPEQGENKTIDKEQLKEKIKRFIGEYDQSTPPFSGRKVNGKPLYYYARANKLDQIKIPSQKVSIKKIEFLSFSKINNIELLDEIKRKINLLNGDFRQNEILKKWESLLKEKNEFYTLELLIECSSGTYIRSIANDLGKDFGKGILLNLIRTKIDRFRLDQTIRI